MLNGEFEEIVIVGAGRLAKHLGLALFEQGLKIIQIYNRTPESGRDLAGKVGAAYTDDLQKINSGADLYILAVADSVLEDLSSVLRLDGKLVVHASGTIDMDVLSPVSLNRGVFYPLQTFSQNGSVDFRRVPICIEGSSQESLRQLKTLADKISRNVHYLNSEKRRILHLGAVISSNFTNFLYAITEDLLRSNEIPLSLLEPLIQQTAGNVKHGNLFLSQTGPAARNDYKVLEKHRELLAGYPDFLEIYNLLSENIINYKPPHGKL
ncbi:MAG: Rossmann-like and DUF2520 domain-containing protein [Bacteroidales bacterium]